MGLCGAIWTIWALLPCSSLRKDWTGLIARMGLIIARVGLNSSLPKGGGTGLIMWKRARTSTGRRSGTCTGRSSGTCGGEPEGEREREGEEGGGGWTRKIRCPGEWRSWLEGDKG